MNAPTPIPAPATTQPDAAQAQPLDQDAVNLAKAIRQAETGNVPKAGQSGEMVSRYQFEPGTWKNAAGSILGDPNAPLTLENENKVAYTRIKNWKDQGYNPGQIASMWNSGKPDPTGNVGINKDGVHFDTPAYVKSVQAHYQQIKGQSQQGANGQQPSPIVGPNVQTAPAPPVSDFIGSAIGDTAKGFGAGLLKGAASTLAGASSLGEKIIGAPAALLGVNSSDKPLGQQVQESGLVTPQGAAQKVGFGTEQGAEFLLPGEGEIKAASEAEKGLGLSGKVGEGLLARTGKAAGRLALRSAVSGTSAAGVQSLQQGAINKKSAETGGLVAGTTAAVSPLIDAGVAVYKALNPDAVTSFVRGVAPTGKRAADFAPTAKTAMADMAGEAQRSGIDLAKSEKPFDDALKATSGAKKWIWKQYEGLMGGGKAMIDGNKIADAMTSGIDSRFATQNPEAAARIKLVADTYRRQIPVGEAEDFLQSANAELESYYAKNKVGRAAAMGDSSTAHVVKEADALREGIYGKLNEMTGQDAAALKRRYGALSETESRLMSRKAVVDRAKPLNISETLNYPRALGRAALGAATGRPGEAIAGLAEAAGTKALKESQTNEAMLRRAFAKAEGEGIKGPMSVKPPAPMTTNLLEAPKYTPMGTGAPKADQSRLLSQQEAKVHNAELSNPQQSEAHIKSNALLTGKPLNANSFGLEDAELTKKGGQYYVKREGYPTKRLGKLEGMHLEKAGYKFK